MAIGASEFQRLMWESNFPPVAGQGEGYRNALRWTMEYVTFKSEEDQEWIFGKTGTALYK